MSITFPSALSKPSEIEANLPNAMVRPTFEKLYGFDNIEEGLGTLVFNVTTRDTEANILASTPSLSAGQAGIAFATDDAGTDNASYTNDFYIYHDGAWYIFNNDS